MSETRLAEEQVNLDRINGLIESKADLVDGKVPYEQLPDALSGNGADTTLSNVQSIAPGSAVQKALDKKADLVDGKIPSSQLPEEITGAANTTLSNVQSIAPDSAVQKALDKKADLVDGKIPSSQLPEEITGAANTTLSNVQSIAPDSAVQKALDKKADLVDGKIPASQLPEEIAGAADTTLSNVQSIASGSAVQKALDKKADNGLENTGFLTNCITKIKRTVNMVLSGETLTVKSGSVLYDLAGNSLVLEQDKNFLMTYTSKAQCFVLITKNGSIFLISLPDRNLSVSDGKVMYNNQECWLPLGLATRNTKGLSTLDLIFNGMGFIGNTMFALPGIEGLIPNGRAEDGTLNSEVINTTGIVSSSFNIPSYSGPAILYFNADGFLFQAEDYFDEIENQMKSPDYQGTLQAGRVFISNGKISEFFPPKIAQIYTSASWIGSRGKPSGKMLPLTLGASETNYYAPSNGWIFLDKTATAAGQLIAYLCYKDGKLTIYEFVQAIKSSTLQLLFPVSKGQEFKIVYDAAGSTNAFNFIFDEGEV